MIVVINNLDPKNKRLALEMLPWAIVNIALDSDHNQVPDGQTKINTNLHRNHIAHIYQFLHLGVVEVATVLIFLKMRGRKIALIPT